MQALSFVPLLERLFLESYVQVLVRIFIQCLDLTYLQDEGMDLDLTVFTEPRKFGLAVAKDENGKFIHAVCERKVTVNVELTIRHGSLLCLRNGIWCVNMQEVPETVLRTPVLHELGLDTRAILETASIQHDGVVEIAKVLSPEEQKDYVMHLKRTYLFVNL